LVHRDYGYYSLNRLATLKETFCTNEEWVMSRKKKYASTILEKAQTRLAALKSIESTLDLGNGLTIKAYSQLIDDTRQKLETYNTALSVVDQSYTAMSDAEKVIAEWTERMLIAVAYHYGKNSEEYQMAGGTRRSDRKRPKRRDQSTAESLAG
jgi:Cys-tRNA synthase (O-phospho-L-seryl-tRNA:Cys-tRNA synthase)